MSALRAFTVLGGLALLGLAACSKSPPPAPVAPPDEVERPLQAAQQVADLNADRTRQLDAEEAASSGQSGDSANPAPASPAASYLADHLRAVYASDRQLRDRHIEVNASGESLRLSGTLPSAELRARALELATRAAAGMPVDSSGLRVAD